jgi:hypothetical protein
MSRDARSMRVAKRGVIARRVGRSTRPEQGENIQRAYAERIQCMTTLLIILLLLLLLGGGGFYFGGPAYGGGGLGVVLVVLLILYLMGFFHTA